MAIIVGTPAGETLPGTADDDQISGSEGDDTLQGLAGDDVIDGGSGNDTLTGGDGDDSLRGGSGNDNIDGGADSDHIDGGSGDDTLFGGSGADELLGGSGYNRLDGGDGNDVITGGDGTDVVFGGTGADIMKGGSGDDYYLIDSPFDQIVEVPGGGHDEVYSLLSQTVLGAELETLVMLQPGSTGIGNELDDIIIGTPGNDALDGKAGADYLQGGDGNDLYIVDSGGDLVVEQPGQGRDLVQALVDGYTLPANVEDLTLLGSALVGFGNSGDNVITGNALANTLIGGAGADTMIGGGGFDSYSVDNLGDTVVEAFNGGLDQVYIFGGADGYVLPDNVETLVLLDDPVAGRVVSGTGNSTNNTISGNSLDNILNGGGGFGDILNGLDGNDTLIAGGTAAGIATLNGGNGDDRLIGGLGADTLTGGPGTDTFVLGRAAAFAPDTITDFVSGTDKLEISSTAFGGIGAIQEGVNLFRVANTGVAGPVFFLNGNLLQFDQDGSGSAFGYVTQAVLNAGAGLQASDFVVTSGSGSPSAELADAGMMHPAALGLSEVTPPATESAGYGAGFQDLTWSAHAPSIGHHWTYEIF